MTTLSMNLCEKIMVGTTIALLGLIQGCISNTNSRMYKICSPISDVPMNKTDLETKLLAEQTFDYFHENVRSSFENVEFRSATSRELDYDSGRYLTLRDGIVFVELGLNDEMSKIVIFHELVHRLDFQGCIDRDKFFSIYNSMDSEIYIVKNQIEAIINDPNYNLKFVKDLNSERIAFIFDYWYSEGYLLPKEMVEFSKTFLDSEFVEKQQQSLNTAKE